MIYSPIPCTQEQLIPTRWITGGYPDRETVAEHLRTLRQRYGTETARECKRRMLWIGIFPTQSMKRRPNHRLEEAIEDARAYVRRRGVRVFISPHSCRPDDYALSVEPSTVDVAIVRIDLTIDRRGGNRWV